MKEPTPSLDLAEFLLCSIASVIRGRRCCTENKNQACLFSGVFISPQHKELVKMRPTPYEALETCRLVSSPQVHLHFEIL